MESITVLWDRLKVMTTRDQLVHPIEKRRVLPAVFQVEHDAQAKLTAFSKSDFQRDDLLRGASVNKCQ